MITGLAFGALALLAAAWFARLQVAYVPTAHDEALKRSEGMFE